MARTIARGLQFFAQDIEGNPLNEDLIRLADKIIHECRQKLALVTDEDSRHKLNNVIDSTCAVVRALYEKKDNIIVREAYAQVQEDALKLPMQAEQQGNLVSTVSNHIATACIFVLASSFAFSLGFAFYSWYFYGFQMAAVTDYLVTALATIGIPGGTLGAFAHMLGRSSSEESAEIGELQQDIDSFCQLAAAN